MTVVLNGIETNRHYIEMSTTQRNGIQVFDVSVCYENGCGLYGMPLKHSTYTDKKKAQATYNRYVREFK